MNKHHLIRAVIAILILSGITLAILNHDLIKPERIRAGVQQLGLLAPVIFMALFALTAVLAIPATVMVITGGLLFGPWLGTFYNVTGATLGAVLAFVISRYMASAWASRMIEQKAGERMKRIIAGVEKEGWRFVAFTRLVPIIPYFALNYLMGLTRIPLAQYALATYIALIPSIFAFTYLADAGRQAVNQGEGFAGKIVLGIAMVGLIAAIPAWLRMRRQKREQLAISASKNTLK